LAGNGPNRNGSILQARNVANEDGLAGHAKAHQGALWQGVSRPGIAGEEQSELKRNGLEGSVIAGVAQLV
jgi:hypothetical protein